MHGRTARVALATLCLWAASGACAQDAGTEPEEDAPKGLLDWGMPRLGVHLVSHHWPQEHGGRKWNNFNPGLNARWNNGVTVGTYRNSEYHQSFYGGWTWTNAACGPALTLGIITGYSKGTLPMAIPSLCVLDHLRFTMIPRLEPKGATVLHLSLEW